MSFAVSLRKQRSARQCPPKQNEGAVSLRGIVLTVGRLSIMCQMNIGGHCEIGGEGLTSLGIHGVFCGVIAQAAQRTEVRGIRILWFNF